MIPGSSIREILLPVAVELPGRAVAAEGRISFTQPESQPPLQPGQALVWSPDGVTLCVDGEPAATITHRTLATVLRWAIHDPDEYAERRRAELGVIAAARARVYGSPTGLGKALIAAVAHLDSLGRFHQAGEADEHS